MGKDRFIAEADDIRFLSPCAACRHKNSGKATCAAFPGGIPEVMLNGKNDHRSAYPGDNGIRFEPLPSARSS